MRSTDESILISIDGGSGRNAPVHPSYMNMYSTCRREGRCRVRELYVSDRHVSLLFLRRLDASFTRQAAELRAHERS